MQRGVYLEKVVSKAHKNFLQVLGRTLLNRKYTTQTKVRLKVAQNNLVMAQV